MVTEAHAQQISTPWLTVDTGNPYTDVLVFAAAALVIVVVILLLRRFSPRIQQKDEKAAAVHTIDHLRQHDYKVLDYLREHGISTRGEIRLGVKLSRDVTNASIDYLFQKGLLTGTSRADTFCLSHLAIDALQSKNR